MIAINIGLLQGTPACINTMPREVERRGRSDKREWLRLVQNAYPLTKKTQPSPKAFSSIVDI
jgi:hypothetical protein